MKPKRQRELTSQEMFERVMLNALPGQAIGFPLKHRSDGLSEWQAVNEVRIACERWVASKLVLGAPPRVHGTRFKGRQGACNRPA